VIGRGLRWLFPRDPKTNAAVFFDLADKVWTAGGGLVTAFLIVAHFTARTQGFYYTFFGLLGLQVLGELGLGTVIVQFAAHEWSKLRLDDTGGIAGDSTSASRLRSLVRLGLRWCLWSGALTAVALGVGGVAFLHGQSGGEEWFWPWVLQCAIAGASLALVPLSSIVEGTNQVARLYGFRLAVRVLSSLATWLAIVRGAGLWIIPLAGTVSLLGTTLFLALSYRAFLESLCQRPAGPRIDWRREMLPMQWRIAVSWISGYLSFYFAVPVLFKFSSPEVAGRFGLSRSLVFAAGACATSWLWPRVPTLASLAAGRQREAVERLHFAIVARVITVMISLSAGLWLVVLTAAELGVPQAERVLEPMPFGILLLGHVIQVASTPFAAYMRAHRTEPLAAIAVVHSILSLVTTLVFAAHWQALGAALSYLAVNVLLAPVSFWIWARCRRLWYGDEPARPLGTAGATT